VPCRCTKSWRWKGEPPRYSTTGQSNCVLLLVGASKADARKAYRELAKKWHPDKHPTNQEEAKLKFQAIQKAYDSLMTTDEDARIEALGQ